ncbi:hypothetical protein HHK36_007537 [Tetracentron sinense]|uniref:DUF7950 domain-containing protein n=1 Tax=Tetracentron sinense TaxID=13715 RepID=A0A834ZL75_TETSI|nr:hypothetical protein HHK36_007537 [Tetracentron sinense]
MDGRGGCCIAQYAGGAYDMSKLDSIMLRYRPIAPKPAVSGSVSGNSTPENNNVLVRTGRAKRRYVRDSNNNKRSKRNRMASSEEKKDGLNEMVVTLPLLPERPDPKDSPARDSPSDYVQYPQIWLDFNSGFGVSDRTTVIPPPMSTVGSCVTVECVTGICMDDGVGLGRTDEEKRRNLEGDTCPGFVSDGLNMVRWTNEAYRRMVGQGEGEGEGEMIVWLVVKERLPVLYPEFACRVRVCGKERKSFTVPCDVWRMDSGGFAWRLDVKAALCLGR